MSRRLFTSESVTEGHPDKMCDAISDTILDALIAEDPRSRVAVEALVNTGQGVDTGYESRVEGDEDEISKQGAGNQGLMFGSRTNRVQALKDATGV